MKRKDFIKQSLLTGIAGSMLPKIAKAKNTTRSTYDKLMDQVGFNHIPNKEHQTMNTVLHKASSRGHANHGWLNSHHSFSFANYYNPDRMNFGVLRVLNDDTVAPGRGFGTHPHDNMEIISIPLDGDLEHKDSMGNIATIKQGDVQVMSAGTGIRHSEYNANKDKEVKFLQIWIFPNQRDVSPRYDQITLSEAKSKNQLQQILSPNPEDDGVWIHQNAWFNMGNLSKGQEVKYQLNDDSNGVYAFILSGGAIINEQTLESRDGYGIWNIDHITITANSDTRILLMEVPMSV